MDAFYASVEQRDNPDLRGRPVAVGGSERRGVVCSASYEARQFGVRSAQPGFKAKQLCNNIVFVKPDFDKYREASEIIRGIFFEYTDLVEPLSLDEAYLDITENKMGISSALMIAEEIRQKIFQRTGLTASAGVSYNKFLAKTASDINKPNGIKVITMGEAQDFLAALKVSKFYGVGKKTADKMERMGIYTGADLLKLDKLTLSQRFGKSGMYYYDIVRGVDHRKVNPSSRRKSIGIERTFDSDIQQPTLILEKLNLLLDKLWTTLEKKDTYGRTITLKLRYKDFTTLTRSKSTKGFIKEKFDGQNIVSDLFHNMLPLEQTVRLLGLSVGNLNNEEPSIYRQLEIPFDED
jgi:DNA polymerase-4